MQFKVAKASRKTGETLQEMVGAALVEANVTAATDCVICYGVGYSGELPALNSACSTHNKYEQARLLHASLGDNAIKDLTPEEAKIHLEEYGIPLFARKIIHSKGKDIKIALEGWQINGLVASGSEFFTPHVPSVREFRTWVYRKRHLGTYEKLLRRPEQCRRLGRNYDNGFDFSGIDHDSVADGLKDVARKAIAALNLDFGAVDVLQKADGTFVVLEVNSAPGVAHEKRKVITGLCKRIVRWVANGCPARSSGE